MQNNDLLKAILNDCNNMFKDKNQKMEFIKDIYRVYIKYNISPTTIRKIIEEMQNEDTTPKISAKTSSESNNLKREMKIPVLKQELPSIKFGVASYKPAIIVKTQPVVKRKPIQKSENILKAIMEHPVVNGNHGYTIKVNNLIKYIKNKTGITAHRDELIMFMGKELNKLLYYDGEVDRFVLRRSQNNTADQTTQFIIRAQLEKKMSKPLKKIQEKSSTKPQLGKLPFLDSIIEKKKRGQELTGMEEDYLKETLRDRHLTLCTSCMNKCYKEGINACLNYTRNEMKATKIRSMAYKR